MKLQQELQLTQGMQALCRLPHTSSLTRNATLAIPAGHRGREGRTGRPLGAPGRSSSATAGGPQSAPTAGGRQSAPRTEHRT